MHTSLVVDRAHSRVFEFAVALAAANRVFTLHQLARHPDVSWRSQPVKRASEMLRPYAPSFDRTPGAFGEPFIFRLSALERRKRGIKQRPISARTQHIHHWLALGDVWMTLTFAGGRPLVWIPEPKDSAGFDVFFVWSRVAYLAEVQRWPIQTKQWKEKWRTRMEWYAQGGWRKAPWQRSDRLVKPTAVLIDLTAQQSSTIMLPDGMVYVRGLDGLTSRLARGKM